MMRGRLASYALWQARDYVFERGFPLLILGAIFGWLGYVGSGGTLGEPGARALFAQMIIGSVLPQLALFGTIMAANGMVANDLRLGYFRFLFAKPVSAPRYYAQAFLINWAGFAAVAVVFFGMLALALRQPLATGAVAYAVLFFPALGGIIFLFSTVTRFDWLGASILWAGGLLAASMAGIGKAWAAFLLPVLPPSYHASGVMEALLRGAPLPAGETLHLVGYGAVCFLLGLIVLRYRPLAS